LTFPSYGPKGEFLINSTIVRVLSTEEEALGFDLCSTLVEIVTSKPKKFDSYDPSCDLIELKDFISFILTPFVAALLIAEDRDLDLTEADDVRDASNDFGDLMQPEDDADSTIDDLHRANIRAMKGSENVFFQSSNSRTVFSR
jgi:RTC4-like domain